MIIPSDTTQRGAWLTDIIRRCFISRQDRLAEYNRLRNYYLMGDPYVLQTYNRIQAHVDMIGSYLFAGETTRFTIIPGQEASELDIAGSRRRSVDLNDRWSDAGADTVVGEALRWALVYDTTFVKVLWANDTSKKGDIAYYYCEPHNIGVLREDVPHMHRQEAVSHRFLMGRSQAKRLASVASDPSAYYRLQFAEQQKLAEEENYSGLSSLIVTAVSPNIQGEAFGTTPSLGASYIPARGEDMVVAYETWVWDDAARDYRVFTSVDPDIILFDRTGIYIPGEHPFVKVTPNPLPGYIWGLSEVAGLTGLQDWENRRIEQIKTLMEKTVNPPKAIIGTMGLSDEKLRALNSANGILGMQMGSKVEEFAPHTGGDVFSEINYIHELYADFSGISGIIQGRGEPGVRSKDHAAALAKLSSARIKKRALLIEDSVERIGDLTEKLVRRHDDTHFDAEILPGQKVPFVSAQLSDDYVVKVDAHSSSPVFMDEQTGLAFELYKAQVIDGEDLLDMTNIHNKEYLKRKYRDRMQVKAQMEAQQQQQQGQPSPSKERA